MLLIITNKSDLTADYLILKLEKQNIPFLRLNTEDYLSNYEIDITLSNNSLQSHIVFFNGKVIDIEKISGVYFRQPIVPDLSFDISVAELEFAQRESLEMLRSLWRIIDEKLWLNHPKYLLLANNKIEQLQKAVKIGFDIPPTCLSTNASTIKNFYASSDNDMIAKAVKHGFYKNIHNVQVAPTQLVDRDFIENINDYAKLPMILQRRIEKEYDVRVTVVGDKVYATAIHSQDYKETKIDWRLWDMHDNIDLKHSKIDLPKDIADLCIKITHTFNLNYSAIDLILSTDNRYHFLEMNPNGQWVWIEEKVNYPIRDTIINFLGLTSS